MSTSHPVSAVNSFRICAGDILIGIWGYEQTNASFYRVEKRTPKQAVLIRLNNNTSWTGYHGEALPGEDCGDKAIRRKVTPSGNEEVIYEEHFILRKWNGKAVRVTSYS